MSRVDNRRRYPLSAHAEVGALLLCCRQREECLEISKPSVRKEMMQREPWAERWARPGLLLCFETTGSHLHRILRSD